VIDAASHSSHRTSLIEHIAFGVLFLCLCVVYAYMGMRHALLSPVWVYLVLYGLAFGVYVYAGVRLKKHFERHAKLYVVLIFLTAVVFRLLVIQSPPSLSTDVYRYIWDGRLTVHGINPYRYTPMDSRIASLRDASIWFPMEYKYYDTIYMSVSQAIFAVNYFIFGSSIEGYKIVYMLFDFGVMALVAQVLKQRGFPQTNLYWYAWCPLPITEISIAAHQDVVGILCLLGALLLMLRKRPLRSGALLIAAGFTKGFAFLLMPLFIRRYGKQMALYLSIAFIVLGLPMWVCIPWFVHGMMQYLSHVHVNSGLFHFVYKGLSWIAPGWAYLIASRLSNLALLAVIVWSAARPVASDTEMFRRAIIVLSVFLLVSPTLFPWYVLWLLPIALFYRKNPPISMIVLAGCIGLMYLYYFEYATLWWFRLLEYTPFYALLWREYKQGYWSSSYSADDCGGAGAFDALEGTEIASTIPADDPPTPGVIGTVPAVK